MKGERLVKNVREVEIFDVSYDGAGVGKLDDKVVFVPKTLPNEKVQVRVEDTKGKYLTATCEKVFVASEKREAAKCPYFEICGGCDFQHCGYDFEKQLKEKILKSELAKVGYFGELEFVKSDKRFFYRNKIKLEVEGDKIGYFKPKSHNFFEVKTCPISDEKILKTLPLIEEFLRENCFENLKNVYIKSVDENVAIFFLFSKNAKKMQKNVKKIDIFRKFWIFFAYGDILESDKTEVEFVFGQKKFFKKFRNFQFEISPQGFSQVNDTVAAKLYDFVVEFCQSKNVVNAYSGQGLLTAMIASKAKSVFGIELQKSAHACAEKLKKVLAIENMHNVCGKVEERLAGVLAKEKIDLIVLDPAREGCKKAALEEMISGKVGEIVYVSCNFATLVRDLKVLQSAYKLSSVRVFDMFPCTANMETVAILKRI